MKKVIIALAALAASSAAVAGPSWTYVDGAYIQQSSSEELAGIKSSKGYEFAGSFGFLETWHVNALYGNDESKPLTGSSTEVDYWRIGAGAHPAITDNTDFVAEIGYTQWDVKDANPSVEPNAVDLVVGVRSMITDQFELNGYVTTQVGSSDFGGSDDDFTIFVPSVGGQYFFTDNFSVNMSYEWGSTQNIVLGSKDSATFGVRWSF
jgi:hypothetical protein